MVTVKAFTVLMHTSQVTFAVATTSSFWHLLCLAKVRESISDVAVIIRHTLIVRGRANSPYVHQKVAEKKDRLFRICPSQYQTQHLWSTGPTALPYNSSLDTIFLQHKNKKHKQSTLTFIAWYWLRPCYNLTKHHHNCFINSGNVTTNLYHWRGRRQPNCQDSCKKSAYQGTWNLWWDLVCWHPTSNQLWIPHQHVCHLSSSQFAVLSPADNTDYWENTHQLSATLATAIHISNTVLHNLYSWCG